MLCFQRQIPIGLEYFTETHSWVFRQFNHFTFKGQFWIAPVWVHQHGLSWNYSFNILYMIYNISYIPHTILGITCAVYRIPGPFTPSSVVTAILINNFRTFMIIAVSPKTALLSLFRTSLMFY